MSTLQSVGAAVRRLLRRERYRQWGKDDGPGRAYRWVVAHPVVVTVGVALVLAVVLGATFGVPPLSPLLLVVVLVAPLPIWLRTERRILEQWQRGEPLDGLR